MIYIKIIGLDCVKTYSSAKYLQGKQTISDEEERRGFKQKSFEAE